MGFALILDAQACLAGNMAGNVVSAHLQHMITQKRSFLYNDHDSRLNTSVHGNGSEQLSALFHFRVEEFQFVLKLAQLSVKTRHEDPDDCKRYATQIQRIANMS
jgi:hypothetical protein